MADPTTPSAGATALLAVLVAAFGPLLGPYIVIIVGAFGGTLVAVMRAAPMGMLGGAKYMATGCITAIFTSSAVAWMWSSWLGLPAAEILVFASFWIGLRTEWLLGMLSTKIEGGSK